MPHKILFKKEWQNVFFQKVTFFEKMGPDSKQDARKSWDLHSILYKYVGGSVRTFFWKRCNIETNIEYFAFPTCCNLIF